MLGLVEETGEKTKVLGIVWDTEKDNLQLELGKMLKLGGNAPTKRGILITLASLFAPMGILSPVAVIAKVLFRICVRKR